jgi:hypothetical protein
VPIANKDNKSNDDVKIIVSIKKKQIVAKKEIR